MIPWEALSVTLLAFQVVQLQVCFTPPAAISALPVDAKSTPMPESFACSLYAVDQKGAV